MGTDKRKRRNEIVIFLINVFFMEAIGKVAVIALIWVFRFFGMPQLYNLYYSNSRISKWVFCIILMVATGISIARIMRQAKNRPNKKTEDVH